MANISTANLQDKDIRNLEIKEKRYARCVGNPKELYIMTYPSGKKSFYLNYQNKMITIKEYREGIFSVAEARKQAIAILKELESGQDIEVVLGKSDKYNFTTLADRYLQIKKDNGLSAEVLKKMKQRIEKYLIPAFGDKDIKDIKHSHIYDTLKVLYNPSIPNSRRTTIQKLSSYLKGIFDLALDDLYIVSNPAYNIMSKFPSKKQHNRANNVNNDIKGLEKIKDIKEFIYELKCDTEMQISTKHALYLQILSAN